MVISWILSSISKDIVESFLYIDTIRDLWLELEARFGVERQREVSSTYGNSSQNMAMQAKFYGGTNARNQWKKRGVPDKKGQLCTHCNKTRHLKEHCVEIHGYPDWYKTLMDQRKKGLSINNRALSAIDRQETDQESVHNAMDDQAIYEFMRNEMRRLFE
ncbi:hypothetical protein Sango_0376400 [Sesamum angolense]|uniref:Uncharacterized protein n=1 Tax=Sesamum angolense TaxID=2727404 RepID=A0AAE1XAU7_9LAMI|nr:hypothetical protein Sango_0376400 [Sesamum angolense]